MERWRGRVAVVTGASSGIGAAIAYKLQDAGMNVVALARRKEKIPEAVEKARIEARRRVCPSIECTRSAQDNPPGDLHAIECNISRENEILAAFKWVKENTRGVDILVNNAGVSNPHSLAGPDSKTEEWQRILSINVMGLSICTREAVMSMKERGVNDGHIVNIGSVAGHILPLAGGQQSMYFASKHAVRVLTEGLRKELIADKSRIRVTEVSPGMVRTEFFGSLDSEALWKTPHLFPEDVASALLCAVAAPEHVQIHEIVIKPVGESF